MDFEKFTRLAPKKGKGRVCSVANCDSIDDGTVTFHQFPKSGKKIVLKNPDGTINYCDRRKVWIDRVGVDQQITHQSKVCSIHFNPEDFGNSVAKRRRLKGTAIPVLNIPDERGAFSGFKNRTEALYQYKPLDPNHSIKKKNVQDRKMVVVDSAPRLCDNSSNIKDSAKQLCELSPSAIKTEKYESCDIKDSVKHLSETPPLSTIKIEKHEFVMKSAINNNQILDMLLMCTSFEMENLTSSDNLSAINYNLSPNCT